MTDAIERVKKLCQSSSILIAAPREPLRIDVPARWAAMHEYPACVGIPGWGGERCHPCENADIAVGGVQQSCASQDPRKQVEPLVT
jgi:hypothetical protein